MRNRLSILVGTLVGMFLSACSPVSLVNAMVPRSGYAIHRDIAYGSLPRQKLDIYVPDGLKAGAPVVLFFYGGNWDSGDKGMYLALGQSLASAGIVTVVADYRLYPQVHYPDFLTDCAGAFRYVHDHISEFSGDPKRIFLAGHSAGAYNAVMLGSDPEWLQKAGSDIAQVKGVIGIAGPYDFLPLTDNNLILMFGGNEREDTQPIHYIDGPRPPMLLAAGDADTTVLPRNTIRMTAKLKSFGNSVEEKIYPGVGHIGIILSMTRMFRGKAPLRQDIIDFVTKPAN